MKRTQLFTKTSKTAAKDADSVNARLLLQAGYINQEMAGVYSFLPLGIRVLTNIENIVRQEMNAINGQEVFMSSLSSKDIWEQTDRWEGFDALFKVPGANDKEYGLNPTHEEVITPLVKKYAQSYKDLPVAVYQVQTKFRNEPRAKSGILRGREFRMKDLYSFHTTEEDRKQYYAQAAEAYKRVFSRCGIGDKTYYTYASGGAFTTEYSHEFQTINEWGEDTVYICAQCHVGYNKEIFTEGMKCLECAGVDFQEVRATEVGNIFPLGTRFSSAFDYLFIDQDGKPQPVIMGCYGIGTSRVMGVIAETLSDKDGLVWPHEVAPFMVNIITLGKDQSVRIAADVLYTQLLDAGIEVLFDDRDVSAGEKFTDNDLLGVPYRIVVSNKTIANNQYELKERSTEGLRLVDTTQLINFILETHPKR